MKTIKIILGIAVIVLIGLIISQRLTSTSQKDESFTVGAVLPLTGFGGYWGEPVLRGIEMAKKEIREQYPDTTFDVVIEDGASTPKDSASAAQKLIDIDKVDVLYTEFSTISSTLSPITQQADIPFVYSAFNERIRDENPTSVKTFINYADVCADLGAYMQDHNLEKVVIFSQFADVPPYCKETLLAHLEEENIRVYKNLPESDFRTFLLPLKTFNPDVIIFMTYESTSLPLLEQKVSLGIPGIPFCGRQDCMTTNIVNTIGALNLQGALVFETFIDESFKERYVEMYKTTRQEDFEPAVYAYNTVWELFNASQQCKEQASSCILNVFNNKISKEGVPGEFKDRIFYPNVEYKMLEGSEFVKVEM